MYNENELERQMREGFTQLHNHTNYSLLDGAVDIEKMVDRAVRNGQKALAITDHGNMFGVLKFQKACLDKGIKPIIGCEVYIAPNSRFDRETNINKNDNLFVNARYHHLILLVKNEQGYKNLNKLVSLSYKEGFYYKPRIDMELLKEYSEGLIASSACLGGAVPQAYLKNAYTKNIGTICPHGYEKAKEIALQYKSIFQDDFYLELQRHGIEDQEIVNPVLLKLSKECNIPFIVTNDSHYVEKEDAEMHDVLMRIQIGATIDQEVKMEFETDEFYLKSYDEMRASFNNPIFNEGFLNTKKIADQCNYQIELGNYHLPKYDIPKEFNSADEYLRKISYDGLKERFDNKEVPKEYIDRLNHELEIIRSMGFCDYFLITWDFVKFARDNDIPVGPGRGSAAGSLVAYALKIVNIDPIERDLLFERFLNPERVSMPDIDIDFCRNRRHEVIDYVYDKYGHEKVANIVTFGTLATKSAIRDVARVYNFKEGGKDKFSPGFLTKLLKPYTNESIEEIIEKDATIRDLMQKDKDFNKIISIASQLEGFPRHASTHAAGVIIGGEDLNNHIATFINSDVHTTQFDMVELEQMGLLKMDFLGLRNLTIVDNAVKLINNRKEKEHRKYCEENGVKYDEADIEYIDAENLPYDDEKTYDLLSRGDTTGVFQVESAGMKEVLIELKPQSIEEITACISLYRPGPMDNIPDYIHNKKNQDSIVYKHPLLKEILEPTYGIIVYQEQVMRVFQDLGGFSLGRADIVRRAMSKKNIEVMEKEEEIFIYGLRDEEGNLVLDENNEPVIPGSLSKGLSPEVASEIVDQMSTFASYAFNKSHASAYAEISYQTAFLKANYPMEYATSLLSSVIGNDTDKVSQYIRETENVMNVKVKAPNIEISEELFSTDGEYIYYGLTGIKDVGVDFSKALVEERKNGEFTSFFDFVYRMCDKNLNTASLTALIKAGALDKFGNRNSLLYNSQRFLDEAKEQKKKYANSANLFLLLDEVDYEAEREPEFIEVPEMDQSLMLKDEFEMLSFYASAHPLDLYHNDDRIYTIKDVIDLDDVKHKDITLMVQVASQKNIKTKNNDDMAFLSLTDKDGLSLEAVLFPRDFLNNMPVLSIEDSSDVFIMRGDVDIRNGEKQFIIKDVFLPLRTESEFETFLVENKVKTKDKIMQSQTKPKVKYKKGFYFKVDKLEDYKPIALETKDFYSPGDIQMYIYVLGNKQIVEVQGGVGFSLINELQRRYPKQTLLIQ